MEIKKLIIIKIKEIRVKIKNKKISKIIIYIKIFNLFKWKLNVLNILYKLFKIFINIKKYKRIIKRYLQNVSIKLLLQIQNDEI